VIAGDGVEHAAAEEDGADQQKDGVKHWKRSLVRGCRVQAAIRRTVVIAVQR
jgi:hypothetical protein